MSASSRGDGDSLAEAEGAYAFKHRCIERNLLATGATHLPTPDAIRLWAYRWPRLVKGRFTGRFPLASLSAAFDAARRLPGAISRRRAISASLSGQAQHVDPFRFWTAEPILFDPVTYKPQRTWAALGTAARLAGHSDLAASCRLPDEIQARDAAAKLSNPVWAERVIRFIETLP
jgi:hypothetical protein